MFLYATPLIIALTSCVLGSPETDELAKTTRPDVGVQIPPQDWWKWRNNPLYGDYWQRQTDHRDPLMRPWTPRPAPNYPFTYGPDAQFTHQIYDTPEYFGYDANYPGGRTHFIGYKSQGKKTIVGQNGEPIPWNAFPVGPTTEITPQFQDENNQP